MSYVQRSETRSRHPDHDSFVRTLADELRQQPAASTTALTEPVIIEEQVPHSDVFHVYVIWEKWKNVADEIERSAIILDAYESVKGREFIPRVAVALGLTRVEADEMGLVLA